MHRSLGTHQRRSPLRDCAACARQWREDTRAWPISPCVRTITVTTGAGEKGTRVPARGAGAVSASRASAASLSSEGEVTCSAGCGAAASKGGASSTTSCAGRGRSRSRHCRYRPGSCSVTDHHASFAPRRRVRVRRGNRWAARRSGRVARQIELVSIAASCRPSSRLSCRARSVSARASMVSARASVISARASAISARASASSVRSSVRCSAASSTDCSSVETYSFWSSKPAASFSYAP